jgi:hypothetical protein
MEINDHTSSLPGSSNMEQADRPLDIDWSLLSADRTDIDPRERARAEEAIEAWMEANGFIPDYEGLLNNEELLIDEDHLNDGELPNYEEPSNYEEPPSIQPRNTDLHNLLRYPSPPIAGNSALPMPIATPFPELVDHSPEMRYPPSSAATNTAYMAPTASPAQLEAAAHVGETPAQYPHAAGNAPIPSPSTLISRRDSFLQPDSTEVSVLPEFAWRNDVPDIDTAKSILFVCRGKPAASFLETYESLDTKLPLNECQRWARRFYIAFVRTDFTADNLNQSKLKNFTSRIAAHPEEIRAWCWVILHYAKEMQVKGWCYPHPMFGTRVSGTLELDISIEERLLRIENTLALSKLCCKDIMDLGGCACLKLVSRPNLIVEQKARYGQANEQRKVRNERRDREIREARQVIRAVRTPANVTIESN